MGHLYSTRVHSRYAGALQASRAKGIRQRARPRVGHPRPSRVAKGCVTYQERASSDEEAALLDGETNNGTSVFISQPGPLPKNTWADKYALPTLTKDLESLLCWGSFSETS